MSEDCLDEFIYLLIRDCVPANEISIAVQKALELKMGKSISMTVDANLMAYAKEVSNILRG